MTSQFQGAAAAYGNTLLFIGFEIEGAVEIVVYPRYRFPSDDRVKGYLGYLWTPLNTHWEEIIPQIDVIYETGQRNYRRAVTGRSAELRAHGAKFETAYEQITDLFRESWHGFSLKLEREGKVAKGRTVFEGRPSGPVLVAHGGATYTLRVFPTGSILLQTGDRRRETQD